MLPRPRLSIVLLLALCATLTTGCATADTAFTKAADDYSNTVGADWVAYITADEKLTLLEKQSRIDAHLRFREAVAAKKEADAAVEGGLIHAE